MARIKLSDIALGKIEDCVPYQQKDSKEYLIIMERVDKEIELDLIKKGKTLIASKNYISL